MCKRAREPLHTNCFFLFQTCSAALGTYLSCFIRTLATQKYCSSTIDILCFATQK